MATTMMMMMMMIIIIIIIKFVLPAHSDTSQ
jgi:hypothetical protein